MTDLSDLTRAVLETRQALRANVYAVHPRDHDLRAGQLAGILEHLAAAAPDLLGRNHETEALLERIEAAARGARTYADSVDRYRAEPEDPQDLYDYPY